MGTQADSTKVGSIVSGKAAGRPDSQSGDGRRASETFESDAFRHTLVVQLEPKGMLSG
jgi:hypothetical protein